MTTTDTTHATAHSVENFREHGFAHVPNLLTPDEIARFRTAAEEALAVQSNTDEEFGTRIVATTDAWEHHPTLRELALHPRLGALAEQLAGMPLRVWGGEVLRKDPGHSAPTGWHDDLTFALLDSRLIFNAWIALVDVPAERGCLTFLPGSHRRGGPDRVELAEHTSDPDNYLFNHWPELRWSPRVTVPLQAGDATFHQARTAHYAGANTTTEARLSFLVTFTDADATYRPLPGHDPLDLQPGQPLPDHRYPRTPRREGTRDQRRAETPRALVATPGERADDVMISNSVINPWQRTCPCTDRTGLHNETDSIRCRMSKMSQWN